MQRSLYLFLIVLCFESIAIAQSTTPSLLLAQGSQCEKNGASAVPAIIDEHSVRALALKEISSRQDQVVRGRLVLDASDRVSLGASYQFTVTNTGNVSVHAGSKIELGPGFRVLEGAVFKATVDENTQVVSDGRKPGDPRVEEGMEGIPSIYFLAPNFPNPFNPTTIISYGLPEDARVSLKVYNSIGQVVSVLLDEDQSAGIRQVHFDAGGLSSGLYFYKLVAGSFSESRKMILLK